LLALLVLPVLVVAGGCTEPVTYKANQVAQLPAGSFSKAWGANLKLSEGVTVSRIDVHDKTIYVTTSDKKVTAITRSSGTVKFLAPVANPGDRLMPPVELADKIVFPTAISLELYDYNGEHLRTVPLSAPIRSGATGAGDNIYFGADDPLGGRVEAISLSRNFASTRWELLTPGGAITSTPVLFLGVLFVGTESGAVYAINEERRAVWATPGGVFQTAAAIVADLKADESGLYVASKDEKLYCINRTNGKLLWQFFAGAALNTAPVPTADTVYQYIDGEGVAAITKDPKAAYNRPAKWVYKPGRQFLAQDEKYAYIMEPRVDAKDEDVVHHVIVAVDKETGQKAFESQHHDFAVFGTNSRDGIIYAAYADGAVVAIKPVLKPGQIGELVMEPVGEQPLAMR
jgi:outer membrane protein assembly factor BamB